MADKKRKAVIRHQNIRPEPAILQGGFPPALIPLIMAGATPLLSSGAKWLGNKLFPEKGKGIRQAGAGILRSGDRAMPRIPPPFNRPIVGAGLASKLSEYKQLAMLNPRGYQAGEIPISRFDEKPHVMSDHQLKGGLLTIPPAYIKSMLGVKKSATKKKAPVKSKKKSSKK